MVPNFRRLSRSGAAPTSPDTSVEIANCCMDLLSRGRVVGYKKGATDWNRRRTHVIHECSLGLLQISERVGSRVIRRGQKRFSFIWFIWSQGHKPPVPPAARALLGLGG